MLNVILLFIAGLAFLSGSVSVASFIFAWVAFRTRHPVLGVIFAGLAIITI